MSQLAAFFKGSDTRLGVFYPEHSLIAIFSNFERARSAKANLSRAGFSDDEALAVSGSDLVDLIHEESAKAGLFGYVMREFSRFLDTEVVYTDNDLTRARRGAAVLAVHCPDERSKSGAWNLIKTAEPVAARYYAASCIEHLAGET
jgi:hypothetical protein